MIYVIVFLIRLQFRQVEFVWLLQKLTAIYSATGAMPLLYPGPCPTEGGLAAIAARRCSSARDFARNKVFIDSSFR